MNLILLIDVSGSMMGHKISAVNDAMANLKEALLDYSSSSESVSISGMLFSKTARWINEKEVPIEDFEWEEPECTGMTSLGKACLLLADELKSDKRTYDILVMSDGCPTDDFDEGIETLDGVAAFQNSRRFAIAIGDDADVPSLLRFTGVKDHVYRVSDLNDLIHVMTSVLQINKNQHSPKPVDLTISHDSDDWD